jgi:hypothetical protein
MQIDVGLPRKRQHTRLRNWLIGTLSAFTLVAVAVLAWARLPATLGLWNYQPRDGDVIFQSLPYSRVVNAIEGATGSPYSHCGIVSQEKGAWVVYEAFGPVGPIPLAEFVARGRGEAFAVYRLREAHQPRVPAVLDRVRRYQGRPYDERYRLDDDAEKIYCSELIYLAYREASGGEALGREVTLGELRWQPFRQVIERIEQGPPPLDRSFITPRDLARASQLELFYIYGYRR